MPGTRGPDESTPLPGQPVELRLDGGGVEYLDFSPEFVEAFDAEAAGVEASERDDQDPQD